MLMMMHHQPDENQGVDELLLLQELYWLLQTSVRKIDSLVFQHPPIFLCHVILNHGRRKEIFSFTRERPSNEKNARLLAANTHGSHAKAAIEICQTHLHTCRRYLDTPHIPVVLSNVLLPIQATLW
jgi:hypothetical protein